MKKRIICWTLFLIDFLLILGASWVDFWWILGAKLRAKLTKKSIIWPLVGKLAEVAKMQKKKNVCFSILFGPSAFQLRSKIDKKASPGRSKIKQKIGQHLDPIFNGFWRPTWLQDPSKTRPKSRKIDERWTSKSM